MSTTNDFVTHDNANTMRITIVLLSGFLLTEVFPVEYERIVRMECELDFGNESRRYRSVWRGTLQETVLSNWEAAGLALYWDTTNAAFRGILSAMQDDAFLRNPTSRKH